MNALAKHHEYCGKIYDTSGLVHEGFDYELTRLEGEGVVEYAITMRYLDRYIAGGSVVVDIGVGAGHYSEHLARRGCTMHLVDVSQRLLETTVSRLRQAGLGEAIAGIHHASATDLAMLPAGCCDAVLLLGPLYHLGDPAERRQAITEAARILRPDGLIFAAGINRITCLWQVLHDAPDNVAQRRAFAEGFVRDGNFEPVFPDWPPTVHFATAEEFQAELGTAFEQLVLAGTESFAGKLWREFLSASPESQAIWLDLVEQTGPTPAGLGITDHFLYIGRERTSHRQGHHTGGQHEAAQPAIGEW